MDFEGNYVDLNRPELLQQTEAKDDDNGVCASDFGTTESDAATTVAVPSQTQSYYGDGTWNFDACKGGVPPNPTQARPKANANEAE